MKKLIRLLLSILVLSKLPSFAQTPDSLLTVDEAIQLALVNNYDIKLSAADRDIATSNNTRANAGQLPTINLVSNPSFTVSSFQQQLANGSEFNELGALFSNVNASIQLSWPLFDGRRMYIAKDRLEALEKLGQFNLQSSVVNTTASVMQAYYDVVNGLLQEKAVKEVIVLNEERLRIAEARLQAGFAAQTDALQAKLDLNQRRSDLLIREQATTAAKRNLNLIIGRETNTAFNVSLEITADYTPSRDSLAVKMANQNASILSLKQNIAVANLALAETRTLGSPRIAGVSQLNLTRTDNGAGFLKNNTQAGVAIGASLIWPIYTGGNLKRQVDVASIQEHQANLRLLQQMNALNADLENQLAFFDLQKQILTFEEENIKIARENLNISTERFRLGATNGLESQIAQNTLEQALARRNTALYNLKQAEIRLKLLANEPF